MKRWASNCIPRHEVILASFSIYSKSYGHRHGCSQTSRNSIRFAMFVLHFWRVASVHTSLDCAKFASSTSSSKVARAWAQFCCHSFTPRSQAMKCFRNQQMLNHLDAATVKRANPVMSAWFRCQANRQSISRLCKRSICIQLVHACNVQNSLGGAGPCALTLWRPVWRLGW